LTKSYTTRRSQPMIRSRLRRPTSKSMTATLWPRRARPQATLALDVVFPTPPLPEVTTMISAKFSLPSPVRRRGAPFFFWRAFLKPGLVARVLVVALCTTKTRRAGPAMHESVKRGDLQVLALQPDLHGLAAQFLRDVFQDLVAARDRDEFGVELATEDARLLPALRASQGAAAQGTIDVDGAVGHHLGAGADGGQYAQVAVGGIDLLAGAHGRRLDQAGRSRGDLCGDGLCRGGLGLRLGFLLGARSGCRRCFGFAIALVGSAELRQEGQAELLGQALDLAGAVGERDRQHAGVAQAVDQPARGVDVRSLRQPAEIDHHCGTREQLGRALHAPAHFL